MIVFQKFNQYIESLMQSIKHKIFISVAYLKYFVNILLPL